MPYWDRSDEGQSLNSVWIGTLQKALQISPLHTLHQLLVNTERGSETASAEVIYIQRSIRSCFPVLDIQINTGKRDSPPPPPHNRPLGVAFLYGHPLLADLNDYAQKYTPPPPPPTSLPTVVCATSTDPSRPPFLAGDLRDRALAENSAGQLGMLGAEAFIQDFVTPREEVRGLLNPARGLEQSDAESPESLADGRGDPLAEDPEDRPVWRTNPLAEADDGVYSLPASPSQEASPPEGAEASRDPRLQSSRAVFGNEIGVGGGERGGATAGASVLTSHEPLLPLRRQTGTKSATALAAPPSESLQWGQHTGARSGTAGGIGPPTTMSPRESQRTDSRTTSYDREPPQNSNAAAEKPQESVPELKVENSLPPANPPTASAPASKPARNPRQRLQNLDTPQPLRALQRGGKSTASGASKSSHKRSGGSKKRGREVEGMEVKVEAAVTEDESATAHAAWPLLGLPAHLRIDSETAGHSSFLCILWRTGLIWFTHPSHLKALPILH